MKKFAAILLLVLVTACATHDKPEEKAKPSMETLGKVLGCAFGNCKPQ